MYILLFLNRILLLQRIKTPQNIKVKYRFSQNNFAFLLKDLIIIIIYLFNFSFLNG